MAKKDLEVEKHVLDPEHRKLSKEEKTEIMKKGVYQNIFKKEFTGKYMIPKTEIRFSFIYNKSFNPSFSSQDFIKLKKDSYPFINLFKNYVQEILELIASNNKPWEREYIPVYIVFGKINSFSDPLTLSYKEDHKLLLLILIHELIHNNLTKKYKDTIELHKEIDRIYQKVLISLNLQNFEEAKKKYNKEHRGF